MFKDLMRHHLKVVVQNHRNLLSQNQRVRSSPRSEVKQVRSQAFSHRNQKHHLLQHLHGEKKKGISRKLKLPLKKMQVLRLNKLRRLYQPKKRHQLISMKLRKSLHLFLKSNQLPVKSVRCLARHIFLNSKDNS